jgi:putative ABC transport system permease protein
MKYLLLIRAALWRNRLRTTLTFLSVAVAFLLFGVLQGVDAGLAHVRDLERLDRLFVGSSFNTPLPIADSARIATVPGVTLVAPAYGMGGYWRDQRNAVGVLSTDDRWFAAVPEIQITGEQLRQWQSMRTGVLISTACAEHYGWKAGDQISLVTILPRTDGSTIWTYDVLGVIAREGHESDRYIIANYAYLDESRADSKGSVNFFVVRTNDAAKAAAISGAIDQLFTTSGAPTRTFSEKASGQSAEHTNFNVEFFAQTVTGAALFTLLFLNATTMMQSFRERIPEFAVLKTLGFTDTGMLVLVLAESAMLTVSGAALGLAAASLLLPLAKSAIGIAHIPPIVFAEGLGAAVLVSLVSGIVPGWRARRLSIAEALARRPA